MSGWAGVSKGLKTRLLRDMNEACKRLKWRLRRVWGLRFRASGGFGVEGFLWFRVEGFEFRVLSLKLA